MVVAYTLMGASIFTYIETLEEDPTIGMVERLRNDTVATLWNLTDYFNVLNKDRLIQEIDLALHLHEKGMVYYIKVRARAVTPPTGEPILRLCAGARIRRAHQRGALDLLSGPHVCSQASHSRLHGRRAKCCWFFFPLCAV